MKICFLTFFIIAALSTLACGVATPEPDGRSGDEPKPDIEKTVEAAVEATREADRAVQGTVEARVAATLNAPGATEPLPPTRTPLPERTLYPTATPLPVTREYPTPTPLPTLPPVENLSLEEYADRYAGGPGAIYTGDLSQLAGPAVADDLVSLYGTTLGDDDGQVPLYALEQHRWIYESDYYQSLLEKAKLTEPTQLISREERIHLQHACINRQLLWCQMLEAYFVPNVTARTNRQVYIDVASFPELGIAGPDTAYLIADGTLDMTEIYGGYVGEEFPALSLQYLWGLWPDHQAHFAMQTSVAPELDRVVTGEMDAMVLMRNWIAGDDQYIFSDKRLNSLTDFRGLKTRSHSDDLSNWLDHMGADAQFVAFAEVYTALERRILDAAITGANPALSQRWYEVTDHMNGPLTSFNSTIIAINDQVWDSIPADLQQILLEEGAKFELEALRLAAIQNVKHVQRSKDAGLEYTEFSPEIRKLSFESAVEGVIPGWLRRLAYPDSGHKAVATFNEHVGPYVGLHIERNGSVTVSRITAGPHSGKTMEQVLSE